MAFQLNRRLDSERSDAPGRCGGSCSKSLPPDNFHQTQARRCLDGRGGFGGDTRETVGKDVRRNMERELWEREKTHSCETGRKSASLNRTERLPTSAVQYPSIRPVPGIHGGAGTQCRNVCHDGSVRRPSRHHRSEPEPPQRRLRLLGDCSPERSSATTGKPRGGTYVDCESGAELDEFTVDEGYEHQAETANEKPRSFSALLGGSGDKPARGRSATVTGTTGGYVGPKVDRALKIQVGDSYSSEQVKEAVQKATKTETHQVTVEPLATSARNYAISYRVRVTAMRADISDSLLKTDLWPAGMEVSEWRGRWLPLRKHETIKIFVGNVSRLTNGSTIAEKIKSIYETAGTQIQSATSELFVGKKETSKCQNFVVTLHAQTAGITMEPLHVAKMKGQVPVGIFVRMYGERVARDPPTW